MGKTPAPTITITITINTQHKEEPKKYKYNLTNNILIINELFTDKWKEKSQDSID